MKAPKKVENETLEIKPDVFLASARKAATSALKLRERGAARIRYAKKPAKQWGAPFFAVRVPKDVLTAFKALAKKKKTTPQQLVKEYMSKLTGVALPTEGDDE